MFWIIGGSDVLLALVTCLSSSAAVVDTVKRQLDHPRWEGFVAWDAIMPIFLFVVGAAMSLALVKRVEQGQPLGPTYWRIARRVAVLWILGIVVQHLRYHVRWPELEVFSKPELYSNTLQAIAVGYLVTSLALLHLSIRGQIVLFFVLLLGYWALLAFVPFAGYPAGTLEQTANFALYVDQSIFGDFRRGHYFTWTLTSLGFAASVLMGALGGHILRSRLPTARRLLALSSLGLGCLASGWVWSYWLPLNRHLWTSSMILWAGGWSFLLVALFHAVVDVARISRWAFPFLVLGANALTVYVLDTVVDQITPVAAAKLIGQYPACYVNLLSSSLEVGSLWLIAWYLYRRRILLRA